eukprot:s2833_g3.t1
MFWLLFWLWLLVVGYCWGGAGAAAVAAAGADVGADADTAASAGVGAVAIAVAVACVQWQGEDHECGRTCSQAEGVPEDEGRNVEGMEFGKLFKGSQSKAMQYMFFAERQCFKIPGLESKPKPLNSAGIIGAGLMGGGIAMCCAEAGMKVVLLDVDQKNLERGMSVIQRNYARSVERKSKSQDALRSLMRRGGLFKLGYLSSSGVLRFWGLSFNFIVMAVFLFNVSLAAIITLTITGVILVNVNIITFITTICKIAVTATPAATAIMAIAAVGITNSIYEQVDKLLANITASTSYDALSQCDIVVEAVFENMGLKKKIFATLDQVCKPGTVLASNTSYLNIDEIAGHFFSPANVMRLLENVRGPRTSPDTIATAMAFGSKLKKVTCLVGNCSGFIANRVMGVSGFGYLLHKGLLPHEIDEAAEAYGMRMGPSRMNDLGFYKYDEKRRNSRDPDAEAIIQQVWNNIGVQQKSMTQDS